MSVEKRNSRLTRGLVSARKSLSRRARVTGTESGAVAASAEVEPLVRARYRSAALGGNRPNPYRGTDVHRLSGTAVQVSDGAAYFVRKARGGMALEDRLRRGLNRVRYRTSVG